MGEPTAGPIEGGSGTAYDIVQRMREAIERTATDPARSGPDTEEIAVAELPESVGTALEGKVTVAMAAGRLRSVVIDPKAMRVGSEDLADAVRDATNAAIDQSLAALRTETAGPDLARLGEELERIGRDSVRVLEESARGAREAISAVERVSEIHRGRSRAQWDR